MNWASRQLRPAGRGRTRGRHEGGVQSVQVKGDVDIVGESFGKGFFRQAHAGQEACVVVRHAQALARGGLFAAKVPHGKLDQGQAQVRRSPVHDAGVGIGVALIALAQVGVGVKLHHAQRLTALFCPRRQGAQGPQGDRVLAAQQHGHGPTVQSRVNGGRNAVQHLCHRAGAVHGRGSIKTCLAGREAAFPRLPAAVRRPAGPPALGRAPAVRNAALQRYGDDVKARACRRAGRIFRSQKMLVHAVHRGLEIKKRPAWGGRPFRLEEAVSKRKEGTLSIAMAVPRKIRG